MLTFLKRLFGLNSVTPVTTPVVEKETAPVKESSVEKPVAKKPVKKAGAGRPKKSK